MSQLIKELKVNDMVDWKGPFGDFSYQPNQFHELVMLACGTGIAPMIQVINTVLSNENDFTKILLLYSSRTQHDILLKSTIDEFSGYWNFQVTHFLSQSSKESIKNDKGLICYNDSVKFGRIDLLHLKSSLPEDFGKSRVLVCGTKSFEKDMIKYLLELGLKQDRLHRF